MPAVEQKGKPSSRLPYDRLLPSQEQPELDVKDPHVELGLALVHIEDVTEVLAERFPRDGSVGWRSRNPRDPHEYLYNPHDQKIGIYTEDPDTKSKHPLVLCTTSKDSGRREIQRIEVLHPNGREVDLLKSLPLLPSMTLHGSEGRTPIPTAWNEIGVVSFAIGLSRERLYTVPSKTPRPSDDHPRFFSGVSGVRVIVEGWLKNGRGNRDKDIVGPVVDVTWDFEREGFVLSRKRGSVQRGLTEEDVHPLLLLGTEEDPGLLDAVIGAFVSPAEALHVPVIKPQSLGETGRRGKQGADVPKPGRRSISLFRLGSEEG